jgi:hypothetical protein
MTRVHVSGNCPQPSKTHVCVIYDPATGKIHHIHRVTTLGAAPTRSQHEVEREAYTLAERRNHQRPVARDLTKAKILHLTDPELEPGALYEVDLTHRALKKRISAERMVKRMWPRAAPGPTGEH